MIVSQRLNGTYKKQTIFAQYRHAFIATAALLFTGPVIANNTVTLTWDGISEADGYQLEEKLASDPNWDNAIKTQTDDDTATLTLTDRADGEYVYRVIGCIDHPTDGKLCNTDVAEYSADAPVTLSSNVVLGSVQLAYTGIDPENDTLTGSTYYGKLVGSESVANDGSFNYKIPIDVPVGINGVQPNLALNYNSNSGNGIAGVGWSITGLSVITRCSASIIRDGYISGINNGDDYKFCLDGQRLVEVSAGEYKTEQESFSRIKRIGTNTSVPSAWTVELKSGSKITLGSTSDSQWEDSSNDAMRWHINKMQDIAGNYITYHYSKNLVNGTHRISHIEYTKNDAAQGTNNKVEFDYEIADRPDISERYQAGRLIRMDKRIQNITVKSNNVRVWQYQLGYQVAGNTYFDKIFDGFSGTSRVASVGKCYKVDAACAHELEFDWTDRQRSTEELPTSYDDGFNGNVSDTLVYMGYTTSALPVSYATGEVFVDFDGDGKLDHAQITCNQVDCGSVSSAFAYSSNGSTLEDNVFGTVFDTRVDVPREHGSTSSVSEGINAHPIIPEYIDLNGDGKTDLLWPPNPLSNAIGGYKAYLSDGVEGFIFSEEYSLTRDEVTTWTKFQESGNSDSTRHYVSFRIITTDINADGLVDILRVPAELPQGVTVQLGQQLNADVALNTGSGFGQFQTWINTTQWPDLDAGLENSQYPSNLSMISVGDINGDKLPDLFSTNGTVALNTGQNFVVDNNWQSDFSFDNEFKYLADVNGDGHADAVFIKDFRPIWSTEWDFNVRVALSTGNSFLAPTIWIEQTFTGPACNTYCNPSYILEPRIWLHDMNDDGKLDVIGPFGEASNESNILLGLTSGNVALNNGVSEFLIDDVFHGTKNIYTISGITEFYTQKSNQIQAVEGASGNSISINYRPLISPKIYAKGDSLPSGLYESRTQEYSHVYSEAGSSNVALVSDLNTLSTRTAVANVTKDDGANGESSSSYFYEGDRTHRFGYGSLGFAKIEKTETVVGKGEKKTISEYHQVTTNDYVLAGRIKSKSEQATDKNRGDFLQTLSTSQYQWKVRNYDDDLDSDFDSPHYYPYIYKATSQYNDLDGTATQNHALYNHATTSFDCIAAANNILTTTADTDISPDGVIYQKRKVTCDAVSSAAALTATHTVNSQITNKESVTQWVKGLVGHVAVTSSVGESAASLDERTRTVGTTFNALGQLYTKTIEPDEGTNSPFKHTQTYTYNDYGSINNIVESWNNHTNDGLDFVSRTTDIDETIAADGVRTIITTNPKLQTTTQVYHPVFGTVTSSIDVNDLPISTSYDDQGRVNIQILSDGRIASYDYRSCTSCIENNDEAYWYSQYKISGESAVREYYDYQDRMVGTRSKNLTGSFVYTAQSYDKQGQISNIAEPFYEGSTALSTDKIYDILGRLQRTDYPDNSYSTVTYNGLTITIRNRAAQIQTRTQNGAGWVMQSVDNASTPVDMTYWPFGDLKSTQVNNDLSTLITLDYDTLGRKTQLADPNTGTLNYTYNPLGLLATETDGNNIRTQYHYDKLKRRITRIDDADDKALSHNWIYDNKTYGMGLLGSISGKNSDGTNFTEEYTYNSRSLLSQTDTTAVGKSYRLINHYDNFSRDIGRTYPTGFTLGHFYNSYGHQYQSKGPNDVVLHTTNTVNVRGQTTQFTLGNGVVTDQTHVPETGRIDTIHAHIGNINIQQHDYDFDSIGNLQSREDVKRGFTQSFCYDNMNRLKGSSFGTCTQGDFTYNDLGNILTKSGVTGIYQYGQNGAGPNAVTTANGLTYQYDDAGNMTSAKNSSNTKVKEVNYSHFNKPTRMSSGTKWSEVTYGADKSRVKREDSSGRTTYYLGSIYEETTQNGTTEKVHNLGNFGLFVLRTGNDNNQEYRYTHRDHIGSVVAKSKQAIVDIMDIEFLSNDPWGQRVSEKWDGALEGKDFAPQLSARGFTDHEHFDGVELIHMNGRVYDPVLGRFLSADIYIQAPFNTQSYNRYSYVFNNPLSFVDPSGFQSEDPNPMESILVSGKGVALWRNTGSISAIASMMRDAVNRAHNYAVENKSPTIYIVVSIGNELLIADSADVLDSVSEGDLKEATIGVATLVLLKKAEKLGELGVKIKEALSSVPKSVDPNTVRFSQSNVRNTLPEITKSMKSNGWQGDAIDVVRMPDGGLTAVDNTRLLAASLSKTNAKVNIRAFDEAFPSTRAGGNLQGDTWGSAVLNRISNQKGAWKRQYPNGSSVTGTHKSMSGFNP